MDSALVFDWIEISGLMSFPPNKLQKLILDTHRLTTIIGENLDVGDGERNGVGKSAIIDAILYLYYGKSPRIPNQGLLNYVEPGPLYVVGTARRNGIAFRVERGDNPSVLRLYEKPAEDSRDFRAKEAGKLLFETTKSTKPETSKRIIELLGFDLKLTDVLLVNTPSDRSCFFLKNEEEQRSIVERIFGFTVFTEKAEHLRELRKEENKNLNTKESSLIATKQANDRIMVEIGQLEEKSNAWAAERDKLIKFLTQQINSYKKIDFEHELKVLSQSQELANKLIKTEEEQKTYKTAMGALKQKHHEWEDTHRMVVEGVHRLITERQQIDAAAEIETIRLRMQIEIDLQTLLADIQAAQRERDPYRQAIETQHIQKTRLAKQIAITEQQIIQLNESKCPTCGQDWADTKDHILNSIADLDAQNAESTELDTTIEGLKKKVREIEWSTDKLNMKVVGFNKKLAELPTTVYQTIEEATKASSSLDAHVQKLNEVEQHTNPHTDLLNHSIEMVTACHVRREEIRQEIMALPKTHYQDYQTAVANSKEFATLQQQFAELQKAENPYRDTIDNLRHKALKPVDESEIKELRSRVEHMTLLISLLADRDSPIRKSVLHEWLPELNTRVNTYLEFLELTHRVTFDPNMTATFTVNNKTCGFGNLSTGQRLRVWLATNRAFREIFELINYPINLFFVDELLDKGMSVRGAEVSYGLLDQMAEQNKSLFLITHRSELVDMSTDTLTVSFENGLTTIAA